MRIDRQPGRGVLDSRGFPVGCAGLESTMSVCSARLMPERNCMLCQRTGAFPLPAWWRGECQNEALTGPSVQVVRSSWASLPWLVLVFASERYVDGRFPIIAARSASEADELALARAGQISRQSKLESRGPGHWQAGKVRVLCTSVPR